MPGYRATIRKNEVKAKFKSSMLKRSRGRKTEGRKSPWGEKHIMKIQR